MKAAIIKDYGGGKSVEISNDWPNPVASPGKVVVEVRSASINPFDYKLISGAYKAHIPVQLPKVLGMDLSGVVIEVDESVSEFRLGDEVYGQANFFEGGGSIAELTTANVKSLAKKPTNISFSEAAALPLTAVSAYQALVDNMNLKDSQRLLIHGGGGGIGVIAVQLAKHLGAFVATTVASKDMEFVKSLGADRVISYETDDFSSLITGFDAVLDLIGGEVYLKSFGVLKPGSVIVSLLEQPNSELSEKYDVNARHQSTQLNSASLIRVSELVEAGKIKPIIGKAFPLDKASEAFIYAETQHVQGKVVIDIV